MAVVRDASVSFRVRSEDLAAMKRVAVEQQMPLSRLIITRVLGGTPGDVVRDNELIEELFSIIETHDTRLRRLENVAYGAS